MTDLEPTTAPSSSESGAVTPDAGIDPVGPPHVRVEREGARRYTGYSERGGIVHVGDATFPDTFTPGELLKVALAACAGFSSDAAFARRLGDEYQVTIHASGSADPAEDRYPALTERFDVDLSSLDDAAKKRLLTVVERAIDQACTVGRTMKAGVDVNLTFNDTSADDNAPAATSSGAEG